MTKTLSTPGIAPLEIASNGTTTTGTTTTGVAQTAGEDCRKTLCDSFARTPSLSILTRRSFVASALAAGLVGSPPIEGIGGSRAWAATPAPDENRVPFGAMIQKEFFDSAPYRRAFLTYCDLIMPGNELKFDQIHPEREEWNFEPADRLVDFALSNGRISRGTCHVWWNSTPPWVEALAPGLAAETALRDHIETVADRYKGKLESFDVVNEVIANDPAEEGPLRRTTWLDKLGPNHIPIAFSAAAAADPACDLVINDYDLEFVGPRYDARRAITLDIVRQLQDRNIKVDGVGIQGHLYTERRIDLGALETFHRDLDALGIRLWVTELDVIDRETPAGEITQDEAAKAIVKDFLDGIFAFKPPEAVITWGITDRYSWIPDVMPRPDGAPHRPLPLDTQYRPKNWMTLIRERLDNSAARRSG